MQYCEISLNDSVGTSPSVDSPPKVSFVLLAWCQEKYIEEAVRAALAQDYSPLEIILSDDRSSDRTYELMSEVVSRYDGPHKVILNRNRFNFGLSKHFSELLERASGDIVVVAAGDDVSLPDRVTKTVDLFARNPDVAIVSFFDEKIDAEGNKIPRVNSIPSRPIKVGLSDFLTERKFPFSGASRGFRKSVHRYFGPLIDECPTEDTPYLLRGLYLGSALISPEVVIQRRKHGENLSRPDSLHSMNFQVIRDQYLLDASLAMHKGLIDLKLYNDAIEWALANHEKRKFAKDVFFSSRSARFFFKSVIRRGDYTLSSKISIARQALAHIARRLVGV